MRNQFREPKNCELRNPILTEQLSLKQKNTNEVSDLGLQRSMNGGNEM